MTMTDDNVKYGGEVVELSKEVVVDTEDTSGAIKARDKRSGLVDRTRKMRQVLCYICCAEFGTTSLKIHQKTCLKKHKWGLDLIEHEEGIPKKQAALNRKKCTEPGPGTSLPLPTVKSPAKEFDKYNDDVLSIFTEHAKHCLYCRERNHEAIENVQHAVAAAHLRNNHADDEARRKAEEEEEERHRREEEERHRLEEERLKHALEEEEAHRKAEEEEEAHRLAEEEAQRKHEEELAALEAARQQRALEAAKKAAEEEARRKAEEDARQAALEEERKKAIAEAEDEARRQALAEQHRKEEEERQKALEEERKRLAEEAARKEAEEDEDAKMMRIIREEEAERRRKAEEAARQKKRIALGHHKYLKKHDGVLAATQSALCYEDKKADEKAKDDMAHMSIAHARQEHLIHEHHHVGGETFHDSHTSKVKMVEVEVDSNGEVVPKN